MGMRIVHLSVSNFRGIRSLEWPIRAGVTCLVGCGDSTKTTILEAIELALSPRWNVAFADSDFYDCDYEQQIRIRATVRDVPGALLTEERFGFLQVGWDEASGSVTELEEGLVPALAVELTVGPSLEPEWSVDGAEGSEPKRISSRERELLGVTRLGEQIDRHATWSRGSTLARLNQSGTKGVREVIAEAQRSAISAVRSLAGTDLHASAQSVEVLARQLGVAPREQYVPGLDFRAFGDGSASLALHDGEVPIRLSGLGSRRLLAAAIQRTALSKDGAILVDEVEHGLEPHRITHLIRTLTGGGAQGPQVFMTTHSPAAIAQLGAAGLSVVLCEAGGTVRVVDVPDDDDFQGLVRTKPEALLGRKIVVCEGPTEGGLCWALDASLPEARGSFGLHGVVVANGEGNTKGPSRAIHLARLGYEVAFFGDSDKAPNPGQAEMEAAGVRVFLWEGTMATEQRIFADLPLAGVTQLFSLAREGGDDTSIRDQVRARMTGPGPAFEMDIATWLSAGGNEAAMRDALGRAAKDNSWFKKWGLGERLGKSVLAALASDPAQSPTKKTLDELLDWAVPQSHA